MILSSRNETKNKMIKTIFISNLKSTDTQIMKIFYESLVFESGSNQTKSIYFILRTEKKRTLNSNFLNNNSQLTSEFVINYYHDTELAAF